VGDLGGEGAGDPRGGLLERRDRAAAPPVTTIVEPPTGASAAAATAPAPDDATPSSANGRVARRLHMFAVSVALVVLAFVQRPGLIAPDTKADLSIDPVNFLLRAAHLWEPLGDSGQLQNQAYGYFLPMGPFFAVGHLIGLPAWVVQRAWWALVLLVAFHGMYRLCQRFGVGDHPTQIIAALTFALSSRMITELGAVSVEVWPMAMAPWVLLPLIKVRPGRQMSAAARSGLAIAFCGGVNAVAVGAVLPLPIWWLFTRERGPLKRSLSRWWAVAATAGVLWWLVPLLLLGRYSPPFLDWIENAAATTSKATLPGAFRGTTQWVAWFKLAQPIWLAGWSVLSSPIGILLSWLMITVAVLGMLRRDTPNRRFLIGASVAGLVLLTAGHVGTLTAPWAPSIQAWLDAGGAAMRNTHKFDVVLRVPLTLALAHALVKVRLPAISVPGLPKFPAGTKALRFVVACALVGSAAPALVGLLPASGSYSKVPDAWSQAATWLKHNDDGGRTLIVPGSPFATSFWGDPHDEPFQALAQTKWATRSVVPLSSAGNIRVLNTIEEQLETGRGSAGLAEYLARAGISRVLLRADLQRSFEEGAPPLPVTVRSALADSPGLEPVAQFGPYLQGTRNIFTVADDGLDVPLPQIEIWQVNFPARLVDVAPASDTLRVTGGPESLLTLAEAGQLNARPVVLDGDPEAGALATPAGRAPLVVTDSIQRREAIFSQVRDIYSQPLTATEPFSQKRRVHDWLPFAAPQVTAKYEGVSEVVGSSQASTSTGPWQAVDGDPASAWKSSIFSVNQWLEVRFPQPVTLPATIGLTTTSSGARLSQVRITTDTGAETTDIRGDYGSTQQISVPGGATRRVRLTVTRVQAGEEFAAVSIGELELPGITVRRELVLPPVVAAQPGTGGPATTPAAPETIALQNARDGVDDCVFSNAQAKCSSRLLQQSEDTNLDRLVTLPAPADYQVQATARVRATPQADALLQRSNAMAATASSRLAADPALRPGAVIDGDTGTGWIAAVADPQPSLTLSWPKPRWIQRLRWQVDPWLAASRPASVQVIAGGLTQNVVPDADGWVNFDPVQTKQVRVVVTRVQELQSLDRASGYSVVLPVGASEIVIPGAEEFELPFAGGHPIRTKCGTGTPLTINDRIITTRLSGTVDDVVHRRPMDIVPCGKAAQSLPAGQVRISLYATTLLEPEQVVLHRTDAVTPVPPLTTAPISVTELSSEHRKVLVHASAVDQVLMVHENANPGWRATLAGRKLVSVRMDGWQQGWIVPAGPGGAVDLEFTPGNSYRIALAVGLLLVLLLAGVASTDLRLRRRQRSVVISGQAAALAAAATLGTALEPLPEPVPEPARALVRLPEGPSGPLDSILGVAGMLLLGGYFALIAGIGVLIASRRRAAMRILVAGSGLLAGISAAASRNADTPGLAATVSVAAALVLVACLVVRLDAGGAGLLVRVSRLVPTRAPGRRSLLARARDLRSTRPSP
jgi:arabinofuranan 3-O-arabinosyltransferase